MKYYLSCFSIILMFPALTQYSETTSYSEKIVKVFSADSMEGRLTGSIGEQKAAKFLSNELQKLGVKPYQDSYAKPFTYLYSPNPHDSADVSKQQINSQNIVGFIDNHQQRTIVIGAHYDHIGRNEHNNSRSEEHTSELQSHHDL